MPRRVLHEGPRGGLYYIRNGRRVYIAKAKKESARAKSPPRRYRKRGGKRAKPKAPPKAPPKPRAPPKSKAPPKPKAPPRAKAPRKPRAPRSGVPAHCKEHLRVLEIFGPTTKEQVKAQYRRLIFEHHPDRGGNPARAAQINRSYDYLMKQATDERGKILASCFP